MGPKFTAVAVNGVAVGGGVTFPLMLCDYIIATPDVKFRMPFTDLGFSPEIASSNLLAEWFSSSKALDWGLINQVVPAEQLKQDAKAIALQAAGLGQNAIRLSKHIMHKPILEVLDKQMDAENSTFMEAFSGTEAKDRFSAKAKKVMTKSKL